MTGLREDSRFLLHLFHNATQRLESVAQEPESNRKLEEFCTKY